MWFPHHVNGPMVLNRYFGEYMLRHSDPSHATIDVQRLKDISFSLGGGMEDERDQADCQLSRFLGSDIVPNLIQGISFPTPVLLPISARVFLDEYSLGRRSRLHQAPRLDLNEAPTVRSL